MFEVGEFIMCGGHGVCRVTAITGNPIDKLDKKRKYYILEPVFEKGSTIYTPVDNEKVIMRRIMTKKDAKTLIGNIPEIETVWIQEEKTREQMYKEAIRTYDCHSLVRIIKTLYLRRKDRVQQGKKVLFLQRLQIGYGNLRPKSFTAQICPYQQGFHTSSV